MDKKKHPLSVERNELSNPKVQRLYRWSLEMHELIQPTIFQTCDYISVWLFKLNNINKGGPWLPTCIGSNERLLLDLPDFPWFCAIHTNVGSINLSPTHACHRDYRGMSVKMPVSMFYWNIMHNSPTQYTVSLGGKLRSTCQFAITLGVITRTRVLGYCW